MNSKFDTPERDINFGKGKSKGKIYEIIGPPMQGHWLEEIDHNLFYSDIGEFGATVHFRPLGSMSKNYTLKEWQRLGMDINSIYDDPMFVDYEQGDYRLKPESPAFKIGFVEFDMSKFGLLKTVKK